MQLLRQEEDTPSSLTDSSCISTLITSTATAAPEAHGRTYLTATTTSQ